MHYPAHSHSCGKGNVRPFPYNMGMWNVGPQCNLDRLLTGRDALALYNIKENYVQNAVRLLHIICPDGRAIVDILALPWGRKCGFLEPLFGHLFPGV